MSDPLYNDEAIIRGVTYSTRNGYRASFELDPEGWEALKGMETTRCAMVLVPIQNDGTPDPDPQPFEKEQKPWDMLSFPQQSGIRCEDREFQSWLGVGDAMEAAEHVRSHCQIDSRAELRTNENAARLWSQMDADFKARNIGA